MKVKNVREAGLDGINDKIQTKSRSQISSASDSDLIITLAETNLIKSLILANKPSQK